jgi:hypothetical protein
VDRRGLCLVAVVRSLFEAHASPVDRGFGRMARRPGRIPCRIARTVHDCERPESTKSAPSCGCLMRGSLVPGTVPHRAAPAFIAASPANRIMPTCFRPGAARLPPHPASPAPTTRHDLASMRRTGGEYYGCGGAGITWREKVEPPHLASSVGRYPATNSCPDRFSHQLGDENARSGVTQPYDGTSDAKGPRLSLSSLRRGEYVQWLFGAGRKLLSLW